MRFVEVTNIHSKMQTELMTKINQRTEKKMVMGQKWNKTNVNRKCQHWT